MTCKSAIVVAAFVAAVPTAVRMGSASAATQAAPFTITETNIVFGDDFDAGDFTSAGPLCPSGTFLDTYRAIAGWEGGHKASTVLTETVYTCADGSGTFNMQKRIRLVALPDGVNNTGPVSFQGGTAAYTGLTRHGIDNGVNGNGLSPAPSSSDDTIPAASSLTPRRLPGPRSGTEPAPA
jgi:hypothetical protein